MLKALLSFVATMGSRLLQSVGFFGVWRSSTEYLRWCVGARRTTCVPFSFLSPPLSGGPCILVYSRSLTQPCLRLPPQHECARPLAILSESHSPSSLMVEAVRLNPFLLFAFCCLLHVTTHPTHSAPPITHFLTTNTPTT